MGRKAFIISNVDLQNTINDIEGANSFDNRTALHQAVADKLGMSAGWVQQRLCQGAFSFKTPKAKSLKDKIKVELPQIEALEKSPIDIAIVNKKFNENLEKYRGVPGISDRDIENAKKGKFKACVKIKCIDCSGGSKKEVRHCTVTSCGLWGIRPFKPKKRDLDEDIESEEELTEDTLV